MTRFDYIISKLRNVKRQGDGTIQAQCPACAAEGGDKLGSHLKVWPSSAFNCVKAGGDDKAHNVAIRAFIYSEDSIETILSDTEYIDPDPNPEIEKVYPETMLAKLIPVYDYWLGRGISEEVLIKLEGGVSPADEKSRLSNRFIFPIRDDSKRIVGWIGRLLQPNSFAPKWKNLARTGKLCWPWYLNGECITRMRTVILLESPGDALSLASAGIWCWIVLFGLNLNSTILGHLVAANPARIVISTNNDSIGKPESKAAGNKAAGNKAALKIQDKLARFFGEEKVVIRLPSTRKDWNLVLMENPDELTVFKAELENAPL